MAYLSSFDSMAQSITGKRLGASAQSLQFWYKYWKAALYEKTLNLFVWDTQGEIPAKEIEKLLLVGGIVCVTDKYRGSKGKLAVFNATFADGVTVYYDLFKNVAFNSPIDSRILTINKNCVAGFNNSTFQGIEALLHSYAILLAHTEVTIINKLINEREKYVATGASRKDVEIWRNYRQSLVSGAVGSLQDRGLQSIDIKSFPNSSNMSLSELFDFKRSTIEMFLNSIGIRTSHEKKGNMIEEEISANDSMLIFNISDMEECREQLRDDVNKMYSKNWTVKKNDCLNYDDLLTNKEEGVVDE